MKNESILDSPQQTLDPSIWIVEDNNVKMADEAELKIQKVVDWAQAKYNFPNLSVFIIGSITSNSYSKDSDIDIDFCSPEYVAKRDTTSFGWEFKSDFNETYAKENPEDVKIGSHPFEIYFQPNPFQCMMSVGCYNFLQKKWEFGPEMKDPQFDPISEFYNSGMKIVKDIVEKIRNVILATYETALVIQKSDDPKFKEQTRKELVKRLNDAGRVFRAMKKARSAYGKEPTTREEASKMRKDVKWHQTDAAFKLLDKFGYVSILKSYCELDDTVQNSGQLDIDQATSQIIQAVRDNFSNNSFLEDSEKKFFTEVDRSLNEDVKSFSKIMMIASALAIPGLISQNALAKELSNIPRRELHYGSKAIGNAMDNASQLKTKYGNLNAVNMVNLIATIIYNEAMLDYVDFNDERCLIAIGNVIENRAGGDPNKFADVVLRSSQFFAAKHVKGGSTDKTYVKYDPRTEGHLDSNMKRAWDLSNEYAVKMLKGTLPNVIGRRNMIANEKKDNQKAYDTWGKYADLKIGNHTFGYQKDQDGYIAKTNKQNNRQSIYTVKSGDSLSQIAKANNTTTGRLAQLNKLDDENIIKIGQKLRLK